ncbi:MAG: cysteine desulfurase [Fimbriimonas sp.]
MVGANGAVVVTLDLQPSIANAREDFPILRTMVNGKPLVYLDNAATSQKPQPVLDALNRYWTETNANIHRGVHYLSQKATREYDGARENIRLLLNAPSTREVILTKGCTEAINLVAQSWGRTNLREGDEILLSTMEHHANIVPWQMVAQQTGAVIKAIPITDSGEIDLDAYRLLLKSGRVRLVGVVHVSNALGTINPVKEMVRLAHEVGALALIDGAQGGPHLLVDVQDIAADFYTLSCHKIYAPTGVGVLFGKAELLEAMPPYQGGGDMIRTVSFEGTTYADLPAKFEPGTPNIAGVIGLGAAIEYLKCLGVKQWTTWSGIDRLSSMPCDRDLLGSAFEAIQEQEAVLTGRATQLLSEIPGLRLIGSAEEKAGIVSFTMDTAHPHDIGTILDSEGIAIRAGHHCCMPLMKRFGLAATARASFAFYNTEQEVDALVAGVRKVKEVLG